MVRYTRKDKVASSYQLACGQVQRYEKFDQKVELYHTHTTYHVIHFHGKHQVVTWNCYSSIRGEAGLYQARKEFSRVKKLINSEEK